MSMGIVACGQCGREVHQDGGKLPNGRYGWTHCEDKTPICENAMALYARPEELKGKWCGKDAEPGEESKT